MKHVARRKLPRSYNHSAKSTERNEYFWMMAKQGMNCSTYTLHKNTHVHTISCFCTSCDEWLFTVGLEGSPLDGSSLSKSNTQYHSGRRFLSGIILCGVQLWTFPIAFQVFSETYVFFISRIYSTYKGDILAGERVKLGLSKRIWDIYAKWQVKTT